jgi:hypothetical protein
MTYYLGLTFLVFAGIQFFISLKNKTLKQFWIASIVCVVAGALSLSNHINRYLVINEYTKETIRGKNELSDSPENIAFPENKGKNKKAQKTDGLDKAYAFNWSYGIGETLNLLIANGYGGSSFESPKEDSKIMKALETESEAMGIPMEQLVNILESQGLIPSLYWGDQPGTGGPAYMGAVLLFLFILGMFLSKNTLKWWLLGSVLLCLSIAWGKNFFLNDILFDYLPLFNKFRAVTMILSFMPIFLVIGAALGLEEIQKLYTSEINPESKQNIEKRIKWISIGLGGFLLLLALLGSSIMDFAAPQDRAIQQAIKTQSPSLAKALIQGIQADRASMFTADAWRSLIFIVLAIGGLFAYTRKYINFNVLVSVLTIITLVDLWGVDKRYLNNDKFVPKEEATEIEPTQANEQILKDKSYFRVLNLANPYNDATNSYFHYSAGGYHAAKMRRYQDVISAYMDMEIDSLYKDIQKNGGNLEKGSQYKPLLDMLNIKYFIVPLRDNKNIGIVNPDAKGAVWFVENYKIVGNADEEFKSLRTISPAKTAFLQQQSGAEQLKDVRFDASAQIKLISNSPDIMIYESNASASQLAVFSEIYYKTSTSGWKAYIDGKPVEHLKVNYLMRGLVIPSGKHKIEFKFEPDVYYKGERLALISSIVMLILLLGGIFIVWRQSKQIK